MKIRPIASSSSGNCYIINDGYTQLMIDCGISFNELKVKTNFFSPRPGAVLITHSHADHSKSVKDLLKLGIPCYMSKFTMAELDIKSRFAHTIEAPKAFRVGTFTIQPLEMHHDVHCLGFYIYSNVTDETLFFATDTCLIEYNFRGLDYIMVEANYDLEIINEQIRRNCYDSVAKERLMKSHMEIGTTLRWLQSVDLSNVKRIYLLHLSGGSSNETEFKQRVIEATGIPTTVCPA